jgi:hypothetical protein
MNYTLDSSISLFRVLGSEEHDENDSYLPYKFSEVQTTCETYDGEKCCPIYKNQPKTHGLKCGENSNSMEVTITGRILPRLGVNLRTA